MSANQKYSLKSFYNNIAQRVPVLLQYQFITTIQADNVLMNQKKYPNLCKGATLVMQSSVIPKRTLTTTNVNFFAKRFTLPATEQFDHTWSTEIIITKDMGIYSQLRQMMLEFSSMKYNGGGIRTVPNINIIVDVINQFSETGKDVEDVPRFVIAGAFPTQVGKLDLKYNDAENTAMKAPIQWTYQYSFIDRHHKFGAGDPLNLVPNIFN